jgi:hypothetical protein
MYKGKFSEHYNILKTPKLLVSFEYESHKTGVIKALNE